MKIISGKSRAGFHASNNCRGEIVSPRPGGPHPYTIMINTLKTLLYMGSLHGFFTFYLPYQIAFLDKPVFEFGIFRYLAFPFWLIGTLIIIWCSIDMIRKGRGTPAHLDPPKILIINGLYRHVRNPIYFGALLFQLGYIFWFGSGLMIIYFLFFTLAFHILIVFIEEPILRNTFGADYDEYCNIVPRWIPRIDHTKQIKLM